MFSRIPKGQLLDARSGHSLLGMLIVSGVCCLVLGLLASAFSSRTRGARLPGDSKSRVPDNVRNQSESLVPPLQIPSLEHGSTWREDEHERRASAHPHGEQICASGCAASRHPTEKLEKQLFDELIHRWEHLGDSEAFDELLYFGPQTRARLMQLNSLSSRLRTLARELERDRVRVELRLSTREGKVLADLPPQIVPFDIRHEFDLREFGIPQLVASGTVKRVGVDRLWGRL